MNSTLEILKAGRALITPAKAWTKGAYARDAAGFAVMPSNPAAVCFCSDGALQHLAGRLPSVKAFGLLRVECGIEGVGGFNDRSSHAKVLAMWDRVIAKQEAKA